MRMLSRMFRIAIGAEGVDASERIFEQDPLFLLTAKIRGVVSLYVRESCSGIVFNPQVVIRREFSELPGYDSISDRYRPRLARSERSEREVVGCIAAIFVDIGLTADYGVDNSVIGEELGCIVGDRLHRRLPGEEITLQEVFGGVGEMVDTGPDNREGVVDGCGILRHRRNDGREGADNGRLTIGFGDIA